MQASWYEKLICFLLRCDQQRRACILCLTQIPLPGCGSIVLFRSFLTRAPPCYSGLLTLLTRDSGDVDFHDASGCQMRRSAGGSLAFSSATLSIVLRSTLRSAD